MIDKVGEAGKAGLVTVLVGTNRGAFFFHSDTERQNWKMTGPHLDGWEIYSLYGDSRAGDRLFAGTSHFVYGPTIRVSDDMGENWTQVERSPSYTQESGHTLNRIWQIVPGHPSQPGTLYAGVDQAGLFASRDGGTTWDEVTGLTRHPTRDEWAPGNGGLCLHTILVDPANAARLWVGISAVGVFRTEDSGESWKVCNQGLPAVVTGVRTQEVGRCVHKIVLDPRHPDTLYLQFHGGVFKSTDAADSWQPIESGLPSNFGFPMGITANGDLFVIPLESDRARHVSDGRLRVYRSRDGGTSWTATAQGLPEQPHYVGVLRDALAVDSCERPGVYFGTSMGEVFYSTDAGEAWNRLPGQFPRITSIKTWARNAEQAG
ncbi:MAG: exo-alpha-sialidase [Chloroflexota bacterium]|nr:exo-alpha-sialidase [Chloroflexota bacterium]